MDGLTQQEADDISAMLTSKGLTVSALGYYPNPLNPDPAHRELVQGHIKKVITAAAMMGVPAISTFIGADSAKTQDENWETAKTEWPHIVEHAKASGVKIAIENCPMIFSQDEWPSGNNVAYSPRIWRKMFAEFGDTVGMNLDPSHLVWQMIDMERVIAEFGDRIYHVHAKDLEIDRDGLYEHGIMSGGIGWQVPRLPGLGEVPWQKFMSALYRAGYTGDITVEHEDRQFEATDDLIKSGFLMARDLLRPYIH